MCHLVQKLKSILYCMIAIQFFISYGQADSWKIFYIEPLPSFEYPTKMKVQNANPDTDSFDWNTTLRTPDGEFLIFSSGFFRVYQHLMEEGETSFEYVLRYLHNKYGSNITHIQRKGNVVFSVSNDKVTKTFHKVWVGNEDADNQAVNELVIQFPYKKRKKYDKWMFRVEETWKPKYVREFGWELSAGSPGRKKKTLGDAGGTGSQENQ